MMKQIWFWRPFRRLMLKAHRYGPAWAKEWIADHLYPDDCLISFTNGEDAP